MEPEAVGMYLRTHCRACLRLHSATRGRDRHYLADGLAHLFALRRRVVPLHPLGRMARDRARDDVVHLGLARHVLKRSAHAARREAQLPPERAVHVLEGFLERGT